MQLKYVLLKQMLANFQLNIFILISDYLFDNFNLGHKML